MEPAVLGVVLDSSIVITAERRSLPVSQLIEAILRTHKEIELSLSPVSVAELVHGVYRAKTPEVSRRRREYIEELVNLIPLHPITLQTAFLVGRIEGQEALKGNVLPFNDLLIAAAAIEQGYAVLTANLRHFAKIPGIQILQLQGPSGRPRSIIASSRVSPQTSPSPQSGQIRQHQPHFARGDGRIYSAWEKNAPARGVTRPFDLPGNHNFR